jgi:mono/diheme cytochrome c family protein
MNRSEVANRKSGVGSRTGARPRHRFGVPRSTVRVWMTMLGVVALSGCTALDRALGIIPWFNMMRESVAYDPYQLPRLPAAGTVPVVNPRGDVPAPFDQTELETVAGALTNPLQPTPEVMLRGNVLYQRHCMACHGPEGAGNGPVVGPGKFPFAPAVVGPQASGFSDGYLYGIIRVGRGLMPAYGDRMTHADRWAVVLYMRQLQQGGQVPAAVVQPAEAVPESFGRSSDTIISPQR